MIQALVICFVTGFVLSVSWFSYMLFLIFLGAVIVLFIYVASLASNELFQYCKLLSYVFLGGLFLGLLGEMIAFPSSFMSDNSLTSVATNDGMEDKLGFIYNFPGHSVTLFMAVYLLLTLVVAVKLTLKFIGPMRTN